MKKIALASLTLFLCVHSLNAGIFNAVTDIANNSDTVYSGAHRTISPKNHSYTINPLGLPVVIEPKSDTTKPTFNVEQVTSDIGWRSCPLLFFPRQYRVTSTDGKVYSHTACIPFLARAQLYILINRDYSITINVNYGESSTRRPLKNVGTIF